MTNGALLSHFNELRVVQRWPAIQLGSVYGLSDLRDLITTSSGGSVTFNDTQGEFEIKSDGGAQEAILDTAERIPYGPGTELEPGSAIRLPTKLTGEQVVEFGFFDSANGFFKRLDAEGLHFVRRKNSTDHARLWGKWDGKGRIVRSSPVSGWPTRIDPRDGAIWLDPFSWYGYGPWVSVIQRMIGGGSRSFIDQLNTFQVSGETSLATPHLPLRQRIETGANDNGFSAFVAGRQVSVIGEFNPPGRPTAISRDSATVSTTSNSTWTGLIAVRRAADSAYALTRLIAADILPVEDVEIAILLNPTIPNSGNWTAVSDVPAGETKLEENLDPGDIDITTAEWLTKYRIRGGSGGQRTGGGNRDLLELPLIENKPHAIVARGISASGAAQITGQWREWY